MLTTRVPRLWLVACAVGLTAACSRGDSQGATGTSGSSAVIRITGSDTMVNLVQAWA
jgi:ABC-type phosphate transport system substrate-binding protein